MAFRWITDEGIRNRHKGKEIWILGTGPSLDDYPGNFFDGKILIALNWAFRGFPKAFEDTNENAYIHTTDGTTSRWVTANRPGLLRRFIFSLPITMPGRMGFFGKYKEMPIYLKWDRKCGPTGPPREDFEKSVRNLMEKGVLVGVTAKTSLGNAIFAAVVLGAKEIRLAGCDAIIRCHKGNRRHAQRGGIEDGYREIHKMKLWNEYTIQRQEQVFEYYEIYRKGTKWLAELFYPYGIEIVYCFYPTAEELTSGE